MNDRFESQLFKIYQFSGSKILYISDFFYSWKCLDLELFVPPQSEATLTAASVKVATVNQGHTTTLPPGETNIDVEVPPHPYMILPPPLTITIQMPQLGVPTPFLAEHPEMKHSLVFLKKI